MSYTTINKFCPIIKDNCRTDCMFIMPATQGNYQCALVFNTRDIGLGVGEVALKIADLLNPDYIKFLKGE